MSCLACTVDFVLEYFCRFHDVLDKPDVTFWTEHSNAKSTTTLCVDLLESSDSLYLETIQKQPFLVHTLSFQPPFLNYAARR